MQTEKLYFWDHGEQSMRGWYINNHSAFEAYLESAGIVEQLVDSYNNSIQETLKQ